MIGTCGTLPPLLTAHCFLYFSSFVIKPQMYIS